MQVYCDDKYVGNWSGTILADMAHAVIHQFQMVDLWTDTFSKPATAVTKRYSIPVKVRAVRVMVERYASDKEKEMRLEHARMSYNIPQDAKREFVSDPGLGEETLQFRWRAMNMTLDEYDDLFDHPEFEPV